MTIPSALRPGISTGHFLPQVLIDMAGSVAGHDVSINRTCCRPPAR
jgi:hypothetical protein